MKIYNIYYCKTQSENKYTTKKIKNQNLTLPFGWRENEGKEERSKL